MAGNRRNYSPEERVRILTEWDRSNLGADEFCQKIGIPYTTFISWRRTRDQGGNLSRPAKHGPVSSQQRIQAVEAYFKSGLTLDDFASTWGVSKSSIARWVRIYKDKGPSALENPCLGASAKKRGPKGIRKEIKEEIVAAKKQNPTFGLRRVGSFLKRFRGVKVSPGTINKTLKEENLTTPPPKKRRKRSPEKVQRFERAKAMQLWQTDITYFNLTRHQNRCYLTVFLDDYSRYVVGWNLGLRQTSGFVMDALLQGIQRFGRPEEVLSDQGRQYYAWRGKTEFQQLLQKQGIKHVVARSHHPQTVGKCERLWKTVNDEFWQRVGPMDLDEARERFSHFINHYNHFRPNQGIDNLVPADRFFGVENEVRAAIERSLSENEIRLATGERPHAPVFLVGQIGGKAISMHGERGKLVVQTPGATPKELAYDTIEHRGGEDEGDGEKGKEADAKENDEGAAEVRAAGENALGAGEPRAESESAGRGDHDLGVLDRADQQGGSCEAPEYASVESLAAVTAGDIGYAGGVTGSAQDEGQRSVDESERGPESVDEEDQGVGGDGQETGSFDLGAADDAGLQGCNDTDGKRSDHGGEAACEDSDTDRSSQ